MTAQLNVGMIGGGQIARAHVLAYISLPLLYGPTTPRTTMLKIAEADETLAGSAAHSLGFKSFTSSWQEVTRSHDIDLVDVVTPTFLHKEQSIDAIEHGKSVICEKPLATSSEDAKQMYLAASKAGVVNVVGFNYRKLPAVTFAKNLVKEGFVGRVTDFRSSFLEDWGANPMPRTWRYEKKKAGAGALGDLGSHAIDLARFFVGEIRSVCGIQGTFIRLRRIPGLSEASLGEVDVDDSTMALLKFANSDALGRIESSWSSPGRKVALQFEVSGTNGSLAFDLERPNELKIYSNEDERGKQGYRTVLMGPEHPFGNATVFPAPGAGMGYEDSIVNEIHDLVVAIEKGDGGSAEPSFLDGWKVCQVIEAIQASNLDESWKHLE